MSSLSTSTLTGPATTTAEIYYTIPPPTGERAFVDVSTNPVTGQREQNFGVDKKTVVIENLRGRENAVTLDENGFQFFHQPSSYKTFANDEEIKREYYPESIQVLKKLTGASRVEIFDHTVRRHNPDQKGETPETRQPVSNAHVDQTLKATIARVHRHLPAADVPNLLKKRFQIINLWRPINVPAYDRPLALCDFESVNPDKDTFPITLIYPDKEGETMGVRYSENYRWKYSYGMTPDDIVLIKCCDSIQDGSVAMFTPHTSFEDPATPKDAPLRQSIELRALVFYD